MHVLIIPTMYPNTYNPVSNIFFRDQAEALAIKELKIGVLAIVPITIQDIIRVKKIDFGLKIFEEKGVKTFLYQFPVLPKSSYFKQFLRKKIGLYLFKKYIKYWGLPDIIHVHTFVSAITALEIKNKYDVPYVITEHSSSFLRGLQSSYDNKLALISFQNSIANIAVSKQFVDFLSKRFNVNFLYVPNVVDIDYFSKKNNDIRKILDKVIILNVANLNHNKQHRILIESIKKIINTYINVELRIGGSGPEEDNLKQLVKSLNLEEHVKFLGKLSREEVRNEMQKCSLFALTSKVETFGVVLIEAMACGKPVVSTKSGGPESIIIDKKYGELVNDNVEDLSIGIKKIIQNLDKYSSNNIKYYVKQEFSTDAVTQKLIEIYKKGCSIG